MNTRSDDVQTSQEILLSENEYRLVQQALPENFLDEVGLFVEGNSFMKQESPSDEALPISPQSPTCSLPSIEDWPGPYNFELLVNSMTSSKKTWLFSYTLNKIFIDVFKSIPLQFKIDFPDENESFYVRALPVYTVAQHMAFPVNRCPLHLREDETKGISNMHHVVRCEDHCACYEYDDKSKRYSVVVPLGRPQPGSDAVTRMYSLGCKSSCCGGMNRRPLMIIFTLEKGQHVVGRRTLSFRVCSCPKRDKEKEENAFLEEKEKDTAGQQMCPGKRLMEPKDKIVTPLKRRRSSFSPTEESSGRMEVYTIKVCGTAHYAEILRYLIMLKSAEFQDTGSQEALKMKEEYYEMLEKVKKTEAQ